MAATTMPSSARMARPGSSLTTSGCARGGGGSGRGSGCKPGPAQPYNVPHVHTTLPCAAPPACPLPPHTSRPTSSPSPALPPPPAALRPRQVTIETAQAAMDDNFGGSQPGEADAQPLGGGGLAPQPVGNWRHMRFSNAYMLVRRVLCPWGPGMAAASKRPGGAGPAACAQGKRVAACLPPQVVDPPPIPRCM